VGSLSVEQPLAAAAAGAGPMLLAGGYPPMKQSSLVQSRVFAVGAHWSGIDLEEPQGESKLPAGSAQPVVAVPAGAAEPVVAAGCLASPCMITPRAEGVTRWYSATLPVRQVSAHLQGSGSVTIRAEPRGGSLALSAGSSFPGSRCGSRSPLMHRATIYSGSTFGSAASGLQTGVLTPVACAQGAVAHSESDASAKTPRLAARSVILRSPRLSHRVVLRAPSPLLAKTPVSPLLAVRRSSPPPARDRLAASISASPKFPIAHVSPWCTPRTTHRETGDISVSDMLGSSTTVVNDVLQGSTASTAKDPLALLLLTPRLAHRVRMPSPIRFVSAPPSSGHEDVLVVTTSRQDAASVVVGSEAESEPLRPHKPQHHHTPFVVYTPKVSFRRTIPGVGLTYANLSGACVQAQVQALSEPVSRLEVPAARESSFLSEDASDAWTPHMPPLSLSQRQAWRGTAQTSASRLQRASSAAPIAEDDGLSDKCIRLQQKLGVCCEDKNCVTSL